MQLTGRCDHGIDLQIGEAERERGIPVALGCPPLLPSCAGLALDAGHLLAVLASVLVPLARATLGLGFVSVYAVLVWAIPGRSSPPGRFVRLFCAGHVCTPALVLGSVASPKKPIMQWPAGSARARHIAAGHRPAASCLWRKTVALLIAYNLPLCIWAAPPGDADNHFHHSELAVRAVKEPAAESNRRGKGCDEPYCHICLVPTEKRYFRRTQKLQMSVYCKTKEQVQDGRDRLLEVLRLEGIRPITAIQRRPPADVKEQPPSKPASEV